MLTLAGLYPAEVTPLLDQVLNPPPTSGSTIDADTHGHNPSPKILDVGTGTGAW